MQLLNVLHAYSITDERARSLVRAVSEGSARSLGMGGRGVVFLTRDCNLKCRYCRALGACEPIPASRLGAILEEWCDHGCRHLHLTGGEPTTHPEIVPIATLASDLGLRMSMSTNGTADPDLYESLIERGLGYIYLSFDSFDEARFDSIVGVGGSFRKVTETIRRITALRDAGRAEVYLTINIVVYDENFSEIERLIQGALELRPDDFKLIPTTRFLDRTTPEQKESIRRLIAGTRDVQRRFPFFAYRLEHLEGMRGLEDPRYRGIRCYLPLDERTVDGEHCYPCSIYKRERGAPLGPADEPYEKQTERVLEFLQTHRPGEDPICSRFCCDITRDFNLLVHRRLAEMCLV